MLLGAGGQIDDRDRQLNSDGTETLAPIGEGLSNTEIAARLFVSAATVKTHINAIFAKLGVRDCAQAIAVVRS